MDYFQKFAAPYFQSRGVAPPAVETLEKAGDARTYEAGLRGRPEIRVIINQNDFLLSEEDRAWLRATLPTGNLAVFPRGGHLGNLSSRGAKGDSRGARAWESGNPVGPGGPPNR